MRNKILLATMGFFFSLNASALIVDYHVPVATSDQEAFSHFPIEVSCEKTGASWNIRYSYPAELTGSPFEVVLQQSSKEPALFEGPNAIMKCAGDDCAARYFDLPFNQAALETRLRSISQTPAEFNSRWGLAFFNHADPGGIFTGTPYEYCEAPPPAP